MEKRRLLVCTICGREYSRPLSEIEKGCTVACSTECRRKARMRGSFATCSVCGKVFYQRRSQTKQGYANFCSRPCFFHTRKKRSKFFCIVCGAEFERRPWQIAKGYTLVCSRNCRIIYMRGEHPMLRVGLFTEKQKREWRDDHCARCGATEDLQLDHITPRFAGGKPSCENAQTLCRRCNREKYWMEDRPRYLSRTS